MTVLLARNMVERSLYLYLRGKLSTSRCPLEATSVNACVTAIGAQVSLKVVLFGATLFHSKEIEIPQSIGRLDRVFGILLLHDKRALRIEDLEGETS